MQDRFKFRTVLKTDTHSVITEPYYISNSGYLVNIDDVQKPFEKKYPEDCFWEFLEEIEKQENCQEVSTDSEIIIFDSFDGLIQCTGLKDKNGKLIYEGDIVKIPDDWNDYKLMAGEKREVVFNKGGFRLKPKWCNGFYVHWLEDTKCFEIIGNIYENPELLEVEND